MAAAKKKSRRYPFLPTRYQGGQFMVWLKRLHGWIGMWGAIVGIIIGITGITLNHRGAVGAGQANDVERYQIEAPAEGFASDAAFDEYVSASLQVQAEGVVRTPRNAASPDVKSLRYQTARVRYDVSYIPGNESMSVVRTESGAISTMNSMHLGNRSGLFWVLILDAFSGSLIFLAVTGILLWSKLHGPALLAVGLVMSFFAGAFYFAAVL